MLRNKLLSPFALLGLFPPGSLVPRPGHLRSVFQGARTAAEGQGRAAAAAGGAGAGSVAAAESQCGTAAAGGLCSGGEAGAAGGAAYGCPREGTSVSVTGPLSPGLGLPYPILLS